MVLLPRQSTKTWNKQLWPDLASSDTLTTAPSSGEMMIGNLLLMSLTVTLTVATEERPPPSNACMKTGLGHSNIYFHPCFYRSCNALALYSSQCLFPGWINEVLQNHVIVKIKHGSRTYSSRRFQWYPTTYMCWALLIPYCGLGLA